MIRTHKASGWTREPIPDGSGCWRVTPTDTSGARIVRALSAHSWANDPHDDKARQHEPRIVLISGEPLPDWAIAWLETANAKACERARAAFQSALDDADWHESSRDGW